MAIIKDFTTIHGVTATYHKLNKIEIYVQSNTVELTLAIYASAEARQANCEPLWNERVVIPMDILNTDPRAAFYPLLLEYVNSYLVGGNSDVVVTG